jgi:hypothetical protein
MGGGLVFSLDPLTVLVDFRNQSFQHQIGGCRTVLLVFRPGLAAERTPGVLAVHSLCCHHRRRTSSRNHCICRRASTSVGGTWCGSLPLLGSDSILGLLRRPEVIMREPCQDSHGNRHDKNTSREEMPRALFRSCPDHTQTGGFPRAYVLHLARCAYVDSRSSPSPLSEVIGLA